MLSTSVLGEIFGPDFVPALQRLSDPTNDGAGSSGTAGQIANPVTPYQDNASKSGKSQKSSWFPWVSRNTESSDNDGSPPDALGQALNSILDTAAEDSKSHGTLGPQHGRLGPQVVKLDLNAHSGYFIVSNDRLGVNSQSSFGSVRANVCVFKGKWQYEVQLGSKGVMQLGWSTIDTKFLLDKGVGDTKDSYAYDGNRMRKWNQTTSIYGSLWQIGDIIGCCIDLAEGNISYTKNGISMGVAFSNIYRGPGIAYFPAVSLAHSENVVANFGATPLQFPVEGYLALQSQQSAEDSKAQLLLTWLERTLNMYPKLALNNSSPSASTSSATVRLTQEESRTLILAIQRIIELLVPNMRSAFVVERRFFPFFAKKLGLPEHISHRDKLGVSSSSLTTLKTTLLLEFMWTYLEEKEMQALIDRLAMILMNYFRANALSRFNPSQQYSLYCLKALCSHKRTRRYLLHQVLFDKIKLTNFLHTKPYDDEVLKELIPSAWWKGKESTDSAKNLKDYNSACAAILDHVHYLESLQLEVLKKLMTNTDGTDRRPSSRSLFLRQLRIHIKDAMRSGSLSQRPINRALCTFSRLLKLVEILWAEEMQHNVQGTKTPLPDIPSVVFYDTSLNYYDLDRLGGLSNYLYKSLHEEVSTALHVPDYNVVTNVQPVVTVAPSTEPYADTPFPSFFDLPGLTESDDGSTAAPLIRVTVRAPVANSPGENAGGSGTSNSTSTEVQTSGSFTRSINSSEVDTVSTASGFIGLFQGSHDTPTSESQTETVPEISDNPSTTSSGTATPTTVGLHVGTSLLAGTRSGQNVLIPMFADFRSALASDPRRLFAPGGLFHFPNFQRREGPRPSYPAKETDGRDKGTMDVTLSLRELLDDVVLLYNCGVTTHVEKVTALRLTMDEYIKSLNTANKILRENKQMRVEEKAEILRSVEIFSNKLEEQSRYMAWVKGAIFTAEKQRLIVALLSTILATLKSSTSEGQLFAFTPECYVNSLLQLNGLILVEMDPHVPFNKVPGIKALFRDVAEFVSTHFADTRIAVVDIRETLSIAMTMFICNRTMLTALEEMPEASQTVMIKSILRPYENRAWAQSNWMLVRIWQGNGFGFQYPNSTKARQSVHAKLVQDEFGISSSLAPTPSPILQSRVAAVLLENQKFASAYVHSVLNQLNWAFSEFIGLLQEIQSGADRRDANIFIESRQLKICCTCYELTQALLRVLEMVLHLAPQVITDFSRDSAEALLGRLCMLICQVLNRIGSSLGTFTQVLDYKLTGMENVSYFPVLAAVSGILVELLHNDLGKTNENELTVTKALIREPSFQIGSLNFLMGTDDHTGRGSTPATFSFRSHVPLDLTEVEYKRLEDTISHLRNWSTRLTEDEESISDDDICTICYAYPKSTTFKPCNHRACRTCITHHLLNRGDCFFCKGVIQKVIADDGSVLYDPSTSAQESH